MYDHDHYVLFEVYGAIYDGDASACMSVLPETSEHCKQIGERLHGTGPMIAEPKWHCGIPKPPKVDVPLLLCLLASVILVLVLELNRSAQTHLHRMSALETRLSSLLDGRRAKGRFRSLKEYAVEEDRSSFQSQGKGKGKQRAESLIDFVRRYIFSRGMLYFTMLSCRFHREDWTSKDRPSALMKVTRVISS